MKKLMNVLLIVAVAGLLIGTAAAQTTTTPASPTATPPSQAAPPPSSGTAPTSHGGPGVYDPGHPRVNEVDGRAERANDAIKNGEQNGTLTPHQAGHLARDERAITQQEQRDMAKNGGHLTQGEQKRLNRAQNVVNHQIQKDKSK